MEDNIGEVCPICNGDIATGKIAQRLGFRPDVAFAKVSQLEKELSELKAWRNKVFEVHPNIDLDIEMLDDTGDD